MSMVNFMLGWADHDLEPGSIQESSRFILDWAVKHQLKQTLSILMKTVHVFGLCKQLTTCGTCVWYMSDAQKIAVYSLTVHHSYFSRELV